MPHRKKQYDLSTWSSLYISYADIGEGARDFGLMKRKIVDVMASMNEYNRFLKGNFGWI